MIAVKSHAELGKCALDERRFHDDACQPDVSRGLQVNMVKRRRHVIRAVAWTKLAESFRIRYSELLMGSKSLHRIANLLNLRHSHRSCADFGNHADDSIVDRSAINGVDHVAQRLFL